MIFVDTNVLIDLVGDDPVWADWSEENLAAAALIGPLAISDVVYAELAVRYARVEDLDAFIVDAKVDVLHVPKAALFLAGKVYSRYRQAGGTKSGVLADFFIGAHACVLKAPLLTRDVRRYRTYFPTLELIAPNID